MATSGGDYTTKHTTKRMILSVYDSKSVWT